MLAFIFLIADTLYELQQLDDFNQILDSLQFNSHFQVIIVKLLAKSKLKSLPYNHTDHLPTHPPTHNFKSSLYKSIQVLHQHMRYH